MKIFWLSHLVPYPPRSGVAQRSYGLLRELARRHELTLLAFNQPALMRTMSDNPDTALSDAIDHLRSICAHVEVFRIPSERTTIHRYLLALSSLIRRYPFSVNWLESTPYANALERLHVDQADIVHFDTISLAIFRDLAGDAPCVMNHHNIESHLLDRRASKTGSPLMRAYLRQEARRLLAYERATGDRFDLHVTCSELDRDRLLADSPQLNACVVPNGVDIGYFDPRPRKSPSPEFTFVGTLGWGPNRDAAEAIVGELWPPLSSAWPDARFTLVGSHPPESASQLAARDQRFVVTGFADDVRPYMAESAFFVCPIRDGGGTKLKILNAMAMQTVVIADPVALEGIAVTDGVNAVVARSPNDYVRAISSLLEDEDRYRSIANAARQLVESTYAYEVIGRDMDRQYRAVHEARAA